MTSSSSRVRNREAAGEDDSGARAGEIDQPSSKGRVVVGVCHFATRGTKQSYTVAEIDILAVHIVPEKAWYVIPVEEFAPRKYLSFFPQNARSRGRFERFREAWHLMKAAGVE
jgi:hypothetical protein